MSEQKQPLEFEQTPPEHSIPKEYPEYIPTKKKKRKGVNPMLVYGFVGLFVLNMSFGYLYPEYDPKLDDDLWGENGGIVVEPWQPVEPSTPVLPTSPSQLPTGGNEDTFDVYKDAFLEAAEQFVNDDYVGASITVYDAVRNKHEQNDIRELIGTNQVYQNGTLTAFQGEDLTDQKGAYLWVEAKNILNYDEKAGGEYWEKYALITYVKVTTGRGNEKQLAILQISMHLSLLDYGAGSGDCKYLEAGLNSNQSGEYVTLQYFGLTPDNRETANTRDGYYVSGYRQVDGRVKNGKFVDDVLMRNEGLLLTTDKTQLNIGEYYEGDGFIFLLNESGRLDKTASGYADAGEHSYGTPEYNAIRDQAMADPDIFGIIKGQSLELFNLSERSDTWSYHVDEYCYEWRYEVFLLENILNPWIAIQGHI